MSAPKLDNAKARIAVKGFEISPIVFKNHGDAVLQCEIASSLPLGLNLAIENKTCVITGTPLQIAARAVYKITAKNADDHCTAIIEITVVEAPVRTQREAIIHENDLRGDLDTPRSQIENALGDQASMNSSIKPHEKFAQQPMGDDKRLSQQTENNPDADNRAQNTPELTPSPSAKLQAQAVNAARPNMTPTPKPGG
jgi:hypothetical protein